MQAEFEKIKQYSLEFPKEAISMLLELEKRNINNTDILFEIGKLYFITGETELAVKYLLNVIKLCKTNMYAIELLAKAYKNQNNYSRAVRLFRILKNKFSFQNTDDEIIYLYITAERYDLAANYIYKYLNNRHKLLDNIREYQISQLSKLNAYGEIKKVKKYASGFISTLEKKNIKLYNSVLNELEIAQRKVCLNSYPKRLTVSLISSCNLRCRMCPYNKNKLEQLSKYQVAEIISVMPYLEEIEWNGGEVFLYKDFGILLQKAAENSVKQYITSNGLLINEKYAEQIVKYDVDLTLSIDSANKEVYEYIRQGADFDLLCNNIKKINYYYSLYKKESKLSVNAVLSKWNYKTVSNFMDILVFAKNNNFKTVRISIDKYETDKKILADMLYTFNSAFDELKKYSENNGINLIKIVPDDFDANSIFYENNDEDLKKEKFYFGNIFFDLKKIFLSFLNRNISTQKEISYSFEKNDCLLPFKKMIISFRGEFKPECVCPNFIARLSKSRFSVSDIFKYRFFKYIDKLHLISVDYYIKRYKKKKGYYPSPVYRSVGDIWNSKEFQELRKQIYSGRLQCLKNCYLPFNIKQNI